MPVERSHKGHSPQSNSSYHPVEGDQEVPKQQPREASHTLLHQDVATSV